MRKLTLFLCAVFLTMIGYSQGSETFENFDEPGSSYATGSFTGQDGSTWNYVNARGDAAAEIEDGNQALMLGRNQDPDAELTSGTLENGIGTLSFTYMQAFSNDVDLEVYVNDVLIYTATSDDQQNEAITTDDIDVNVEGDFTLKFFNPDGGQVSIDDVIWTAAADDGGDEGSGETCDDPITIASLPFNDAGNTADYGNNYLQADIPEQAPNGVFDGTGSNYYITGDDVVYAYTPDSDQVINVSTTNDDDWIGLWAFTGCPFDLTVGYHTSIGGDTREIPELPVTGGETYYFVISTWAAPQSTDYTIEITELTCPTPTNVEVDNITAESADLSWQAGSDEDEWEILYGESGFDMDEGESVIVNGDPETTIEGLESDTTYQVYLKAICAADDESDWSDPVSFTTEETCAVPSNITADNITHNSADLSWEIAGDEVQDEWEVFYGEAGFDVDGGEGESVTVNNDPEITIENLEEATAYEVYIKAICEDDDESSLSAVFSFTTTIEGGYCLPTYSTGCASNDAITNVSLTGESESIDNDSGCSENAFGDYTELTPADLMPGETYTLSVSTGYSSPTFEQVRAWIDYNGDSDFSEDEEIANSDGDGLPGGTGNFEFTVPEDTEAGNYRMRVRLGYGSSAPTFDPCSSESWGETEDYTIEILEGENGDGYCTPEYSSGCDTGDQIVNVTLEGESIGLNNDSECSEDAYGDFTDLPAPDLLPGESYVLSVSTDYFIYENEEIKAWIDYNDDGIFSEDEEIASTEGDGMDSMTVSFEFTIPLDVDPGEYRMRVRMAYSATGSDELDPCSEETWGEAEDYTIEILEGENGDDFPSPYCDVDADGVTIEEITAVGFGNTNIENDNTEDVLIDKTDTVVDVMLGETYTLEVEGFTNGDFENAVVAFIDWNQNFILDDDGEVYEVGTIENSTGEDGNSVSLEITVPEDAVLGTTRIRITKTYTDEEGDDPMPPSPAIINPCAIEMDAFEMGAQPGFGQALDFTLNIEEGDTGGDDVDCDQGDISNNFENGLQIGTGTEFENADDFIVSPGNTLNIQTIKLNIMATEPIESLDLMFYDDDSGPGDIIITEAGLTPSEEDQVLIGEAHGFNVYEVYVNVDLEFEGGDDGASYWMQPQGLAAGGEIGGVFWEVTSEGELGEPIHSREEGGTWLPNEDGLQAVFTLYCDEIEAPEPPVLPCEIDFTASVEPITRVVFAEQIDNSSDTTVDGSDPLEDFTDIEAIVGQGMTYDIALEGNTGGPWENFFTVFIDLTDPEAEGEWQEYEMYEIGSITDSNGEDGQQATGQITLPEDIDDGTYTMRIVKNFNVSPTDPCQSYSFGQAEDYTLIVDYELSVDDYQFENFTFYPNPVQDQLNLKAGEQIESVTVHNLLGQKVIDVNPNTLQTQVDVNHLSAGVYLMNVTVNGTQKSFRIIKK
ncbi:MAG TPA: GEVED domain-containing protein [Flavobacteriaceae bacterium]|nr:GEVED domain-containing protein [Flavobacteriaceae bacterium]